MPWRRSARGQRQQHSSCRQLGLLPWRRSAKHRALAEPAPATFIMSTAGVHTEETRTCGDAWCCLCRCRCRRCCHCFRRDLDTRVYAHIRSELIGTLRAMTPCVSATGTQKKPFHTARRSAIREELVEVMFLFPSAKQRENLHEENV